MNRALRTSIILALLLVACADGSKPSGSGTTTAGSDGLNAPPTSGAGGEAGQAAGVGGFSDIGSSSGSAGVADRAGGQSEAPNCIEDDDCPTGLPQCSTGGECVVCTSSIACTGRDRLPYCETTSTLASYGQCVACLEDEHCEGSEDGEYCNNNECVPCKADADCTDLTKPECSPEGQCVGCTDSEACEDRAGTEVCQLSTGPKRGHCVACIAHSDCPNADAPQCKSDNTCGDCTLEAACSFREGATHCNLRADAETVGQCVECTGATEDDDCDGKSCKQSTGTCTSTEQGARTACQSCEADSECNANRKCVVQFVSSTPIGAFCLSAMTAAGCASETNPDIRPYSEVLSNVLSVDSQAGGEQSYCVPSATCPAVRDALNSTICLNEAVYDDTRCGVAGMSDGQCPQDGDGAGSCTYFCTDANDCPPNKPDCTNNVCTPNVD